jgi:hypothetical protein
MMRSSTSPHVVERGSPLGYPGPVEYPTPGWLPWPGLGDPPQRSAPILRAASRVECALIRLEEPDLNRVGTEQSGARIAWDEPGDRTRELAMQGLGSDRQAPSTVAVRDEPR